MDDVFLSRLRAHDWAGERHSEWATPEDTPAALAAAWRGDPDAHDRLMKALANNHAGAWFPVLLAAMPYLGEILVDGAPAGVRAVLALMDDFVHSFDVEPESPELDRQRERAFLEALVPIRQTAVATAATQPAHADWVTDLVTGIDARFASAWDR
jgi:hypothetical protein